MSTEPTPKSFARISLERLIDTTGERICMLARELTQLHYELTELERREAQEPPKTTLDEIFAVPCMHCGKPNNNKCQLCDECAKTARCPHGNKHHECDQCDHESDIAYDTQRERSAR